MIIKYISAIFVPAIITKKFRKSAKLCYAGKSAFGTPGSASFWLEWDKDRRVFET